MTTFTSMRQAQEAINSLGPGQVAVINGRHFRVARVRGARVFRSVSPDYGVEILQVKGFAKTATGYARKNQ